MTDDLDMDIIGNEVFPLPVMLYGKPAEKATVMVRERLEALDASFVEIDLEQDETASAYLGELAGGNHKIPVVVFGDEEIVLADPGKEELDQALRRAGYRP